MLSHVLYAVLILLATAVFQAQPAKVGRPKRSWWKDALCDSGRLHTFADCCKATQFSTWNVEVTGPTDADCFDKGSYQIKYQVVPLREGRKQPPGPALTPYLIAGGIPKPRPNQALDYMVPVCLGDGEVRTVDVTIDQETRSVLDAGPVLSWYIALVEVPETKGFKGRFFAQSSYDITKGGAWFPKGSCDDLRRDMCNGVVKGPHRNAFYLNALSACGKTPAQALALRDGELGGNVSAEASETWHMAYSKLKMRRRGVQNMAPITYNLW